MKSRVLPLIAVMAVLMAAGAQTAPTKSSEGDTLYYHVTVVCDEDSAVRTQSGGPTALGEVFATSVYVYGERCLGIGSGGESWLASFAHFLKASKKIPARFRKLRPALTPAKAPKIALEMIFIPQRSASGALDVRTVLSEFRLRGGHGKRVKYAVTVVDTVLHLLPSHTYRIATLRGHCPRTHSVYLRLDETKPPPADDLTSDLRSMLQKLRPLSLPVNFYLRYEQHDSSTGELVLLQTTEQINYDPRHPFVFRFLAPVRTQTTGQSVWPEYSIVGYVVPLQKRGDSLRCKLLLQQGLGTGNKIPSKLFTTKEFTLARGEPLRVVLLSTGNLGISVPTARGEQTHVSLRRDLLKEIREELYIVAYF